ncbi:MAG: SAVED domain-containing protein [Chloroflexales bacterium]|nr:SAVED domain-containing protein [Chloroflexales bacterium]
MNTQERQHIVELLDIQRRRLGVLEIQAATYGIDTRPQVVMEMEAIRREITALESRLDRARAIPVGLFSFARETIDDPAACVLDWMPYFPQEAPPAAAQVWAETLLPTLRDLWQDLARLPHKAIALRIKAVLSAGLAFGYVFRETTGFRLWIEQPTSGADGGRDVAWWDSNAPPAPHDALLHEESRTRGKGASDCLIELAISQDTERTVDAWLETTDLPPIQRIVLRPPEGPGRTAVKSGAHAIELATQIEQCINQVRADHPHGTIHLLGAMPIGLAVLIGMRLNRRGPIQCYEFYQNSYLPSCRLD